MNKNTSQTIVLCILTAALAALPMLSQAEGTNQPPAAGQTAPPKPKKHNPPFNGKVGAVDTAAETLTVGKLTLHVTPETKITKDGKPATLADGVAGEHVSGIYQKAEGDKLNAVVIHFGAKPPKNSPEAPDATGK